MGTRKTSREKPVKRLLLLLVLPALLALACPAEEEGRLPAVDPEAKPCTWGGGDRTQPDRITDLTAVQAGSGTFRLTWTATGDDGSTGTASAYDLRFSTSPITCRNFGSAPVYTQNWTPLPAGRAECRDLGGFPSAVTFYFAVKVLDEVPNTSRMSNVASAILTDNADDIQRETAPSLVQRWDDALTALTKEGIDKQKVVNQSLITPSCGTGSLAPELAQRVMELLREVSEILQQRYFSM